jgi:aryl-alcohol dehydrogenase-like predicted oxidoreductase
MVLGRSTIEVMPIGVGTWAWGDRGDWGFGRSHDEADLREAFLASSARGRVLFDTAEKYALGESERFLGRFLRESGRSAVVATKFSPTRWQVRRADLLRALRGSLARLGLDRVDLYQLHWPTRFSSVEGRMAAMADAVEEGLVGAVGVSNVSAEQVLRAHDALAQRGLPLATVQVEYSLLHRAPEHDGVLRACADRGVTLLAYSPLAMGMLSGRYSAGSPPPGGRADRYPALLLDRLGPLLGLLREVGQGHGRRTAAQVALAWLRGRGALPIPGAKNRGQAEENLGAADFDLSSGELDALAQAAPAGSPG